MFHDIAKGLAAQYLPGLIELLAVVLMSLVSMLLMQLRKRTMAWIDARKNKEERDLLHKLAVEGFAHAETVFNGYASGEKLGAATGYVARKLQDYGADITEEEIHAAIHAAWLDFQTKKPVTVTNITTELKGTAAPPAATEEP